jgi:hypothetical protein
MKPPSKPLGAGQSVLEWIAQHPDRYITRRDIGLLFGMFEHAQQETRKRRAWPRRLWRWLMRPAVSEVPPSPPS